MNSTLLDAPAAADSRLALDPASFHDHFDRAPFVIGHRLADHKLFSLESLIDLSKRLPPGNVEYNAGDLPVSIDPKQTPRTGLSIEETIRQIETCRSWLVLKNVETDPRYGELLDDCLDEVQAATATLAPGMCMREGFIFVSSPGSVTPYHMDPEENFLLQIKGRKQIRLFDGADRSILAEPHIEDFCAGRHRNLDFDDSFNSKAWRFALHPGQGLYFPVRWPHWVKNGPEVSISFSITFRTSVSNRREVLYRINHHLRRLKLRPTPVGKSAWRDAAKFGMFRGLRAVARLLKHRNSNSD